MDDELSHDLLTLIGDELTSHPADLWSFYDVSVATRKAAIFSLDKAYEERLCALLGAMRMKVDPRSKMWRRMMSDMTSEDEREATRIKCLKCGNNVANGVLACRCHAHRIQAFPWWKAFIGPIVAGTVIATIAAITRH